MTLRAKTSMDTQSEIIPPSDSDESVNLENSYNNEDFDPLPIPSDIESESENDSTDIINLHGVSEEPNSYGLKETPIFNYAGDSDDQDDFFSGWK